MSRVLRMAVGVAGLLTLTTSASAQTAADLDVLQRGVALVQGKAPGSGFVVAVMPDRVTIITARHVVEGLGDRPIEAATSNERPCDVSGARPITVRFYSDERAYQIDRAVCSDGDDVAAIEIPLPAAAQTVFPTFRDPQRLATSRAATLTFLGVPEGRAWGVSVGNVVMSTTDDLFTTTGPGVQPGFSGGPVVDTDRGLAGMVLQAGRQTTSLSRLRLDALLSEWKIAANRLENTTSGSPNPAFVKPGPQEFLVEEARNAIRQYRLALTRKSKEALLQIYPKLGKARVDALFGDAVQIELELNGCQDITAQNVIECEYVMTVFRRTGVNETLRSLRPGSDPVKLGPTDRIRPTLKFHLKRGDLAWTIERVTE